MSEKPSENPPVMRDSGKKKPTKRESKKTHERRLKVTSLLLVEGLNITKIAQRLGVDRSTIRHDIEVLKEKNEDWMNFMAAAGWVLDCKKMYQDTLEEIDFLQNYLHDKKLSPIETTQISCTITKKQKFLIEMMKDLPLYHKLVKLSDWVNQHKN